MLFSSLVRMGCRLDVDDGFRGRSFGCGLISKGALSIPGPAVPGQVRLTLTDGIRTLSQSSGNHGALEKGGILHVA